MNGEIHEKSNRPVMIYVHIPFCVRKCAYCDFFSGAFSPEKKERYFRDLLREIEECPYGDQNFSVQSVFFGGGTPSSVEPRYLSMVMKALRERFTILPDAEISMEMNPGTLPGTEGNDDAAGQEEAVKRLLEYRAMGFNRLSIGLQSADDVLLRRIGRIHTYEAFLKTVEAARKAGFTNLNVDLISGLPGDTLENFEKGLFQVLSLKPEHLSVYSLIIAENTPFYALYGENGSAVSELPPEDVERAMYHRTEEILASRGYGRYEISNYALPGKACRHNVGYWTHVPYLGFGAAAASFMPEIKLLPGRFSGENFEVENNRFLRFKNAERLDYSAYPYEETEVLTPEDLPGEYMMLKLRMTEGVSERTFSEKFGVSPLERFREEIEESVRDGLLTVESVGNTENGDRHVRLTPRGLDLANLVFEKFV